MLHIIDQPDTLRHPVEERDEREREEDDCEPGEDDSGSDEDLDALLAKATRQLKRKAREEGRGEHGQVENRRKGDGNGGNEFGRPTKRPKVTVRVSSRLDPGVSTLATPLQPVSVAMGSDGSAGVKLDMLLAAKMDEDRDAAARAGARRGGAGQAGSKWFDMKTPQLTPELKRDLQLLKLRGVLDPKQHFKREDRKAKDFPKQFQVATILDDHASFHSGRLTNRERKQTLVEEIVADHDKRRYYKRRYAEVQQKAESGGKLWFKRRQQKRKPAKQRE